MKKWRLFGPSPVLGVAGCAMRGVGAEPGVAGKRSPKRQTNPPTKPAHSRPPMNPGLPLAPSRRWPETPGRCKVPGPVFGLVGRDPMLCQTGCRREGQGGGGFADFELATGKRRGPSVGGPRLFVRPARPPTTVPALQGVSCGSLNRVAGHSREPLDWMASLGASSPLCTALLVLLLFRFRGAGGDETRISALGWGAFVALASSQPTHRQHASVEEPRACDTAPQLFLPSPISAVLRSFFYERSFMPPMSHQVQDRNAADRRPPTAAVRPPPLPSVPGKIACCRTR